MKYTVGDDVVLNMEKKYGDGTTIKEGTKGVVNKAYPLSVSYRVKFAGHSKKRRVPEDGLDAG